MPANLGYYCNWQDLEVTWAQPLDVLPQHHPAEACSDLVCNVLFKEGNGIRGGCRWVRAAGRCHLHNVPGPFRSAINFNAMLPLVQGWCKRMHLQQGLRLHEQSGLTFRYTHPGQREPMRNEVLVGIFCDGCGQATDCLRGDERCGMLRQVGLGGWPWPWHTCHGIGGLHRSRCCCVCSGARSRCWPLDGRGACRSPTILRPTRCMGHLRCFLGAAKGRTHRGTKIYNW
jgi:hypothetical protein